MRKKKDISIGVAVPALSRGCVLYVGGPEGVASVLENGHLERASEAFAAIGYRFIYAPGLVDGLSGRMAEYLFPGFEMPAAGWVSERLLERIGCPGKSGFLYKLKDGAIYFRETGKDFDREVDALVRALSAEPKYRSIVIWRSVRAPGAALESERRYYDLMFDDGMESSDTVCAAPAKAEASVCKRVKKESESKPEPEPDLDPKTLALLREIDRFLEEHHLTLEELEILLGYTVRLSRLRVERNGRIFMTDFGDQEVKMDHLTKMVYLFFLRHPEGMRMKEVSEHQEELLGLYMQITGRDSLEKIKESIARHTDPFGPNLNISASRIRKAFKDLVGERVARFYWLEGSRGEPYSIKLDRDYVIWQYP